MTRERRAQPDTLMVSVRPVRAGDEITKAVEGGFRRDRASSDGILVVTADRDIFIPLDMLGAPLAKVGIALIQASAEVSQATAPSPVRVGRIRLAKPNGDSRG